MFCYMFVVYQYVPGTVVDHGIVYHLDFLFVGFGEMECSSNEWEPRKHWELPLPRDIMCLALMW